jgi:hypothetical protein
MRRTEHIMAIARMLPINLFFIPDFMDLDHVSKLAYIGLILHADDDGRGYIHLRGLSHATDLRDTEVESSLLQLEEKGLVLVYVVDNKEYYYITGWFDMQSIRHPHASILPAPPASEGENPSATEGARKNHASSSLPANGASIISISSNQINANNNTQCVDDVLSTDEATLMKLLNCEDREAIRRLKQEYPDVNLVGEADAARDWASTNKRKLSLASFRTWLAKSGRLKEQPLTKTSTKQTTKKESPYKAKLDRLAKKSVREWASETASDGESW